MPSYWVRCSVSLKVMTLAKEELWAEIPNQYLEKFSILVRINFGSQSLSLRVINLSPKWLVSLFVCEEMTNTPILNNGLLLDCWGFPGSSAGKESTCNAGDPGLISGLGSSPGKGIGCPLQYFGASLVTDSKESTCNVGILGSIPGLERFPWRRAWEPTPVFFPRESPWTEEPGSLQFMRLQRVWHDWVAKHSTDCYVREIQIFLLFVMIF